MLSIRSIVIYLWLVQIILAQSTKFTVKDIYTDPGLDRNAHRERQYTWHPEGNRVTYIDSFHVQNEYLVSLQIPSGPTDTLIEASQLKWTAGDDTVNVELNHYQWHPDGKYILLKGARDLFLFNIQDQSLRRLTDGGQQKQDLKFSPDGRWLTYTRDHNIWLQELSGKEAVPLTQSENEHILNGALDWVYPEELDISSGYQWSTDSRYIAFLQLNENGVNRFPLPQWQAVDTPVQWEYYPKAGQQNPAARIGIISIAEQTVNWVDLQNYNYEYIPRFDWLPNRDTLAIQLLNREQNVLRLLFYDLGQNTCHEVLCEKDPYWVNVTDAYYYFSDRNNFIWYSEQDGFLHLYLYDYHGCIIEQLTTGPWMVTRLNGVDQQNNRIFFTATRQSPLERHIYACDLGTKEMIRIDKDRGTHAAKFIPDYNHYLETFSNVNHPAEIYVTNTQGQRVTTLYANHYFDKEKYGLGDTEFFEIQTEEGMRLYCSLIYPRDFNPQKKYPVLVYVYGGPHGQRVRNRFDRIWNHLLSQHDYLIFSLDNRGSFARGREWERKIYLQMGEYELKDQLCGVDYLKNLDYVDPDRIGIWGWSYGGYMTLIALTKAPDVYKTGIAVAPVTHWKYYDTIYTERYMGMPADNTHGYQQSAPLNFVSNISRKFLLAHGLADDNVHVQNSIALAAELVRHNKDFDLMIYPEQKHGISADEARIHLFEKMTAFILENL